MDTGRSEPMPAGNGVMAELNSCLNACSPTRIKITTLAHRDDRAAAGLVADSRIKRYYRAQLEWLIRYERLAAAKASRIHQRLAYARYQIARDIFHTEVWTKYPELIDQFIEVYDDGSLGPKEEVATGVPPARASRTSREVCLAGIRGLGAAK